MARHKRAWYEHSYWDDAMLDIKKGNLPPKTLSGFDKKVFHRRLDFDQKVRLMDMGNRMRRSKKKF